MNRALFLLLLFTLVHFNGKAAHVLKKVSLQPNETQTFIENNTTAFYLHGEVSFSSISYKTDGAWQAMRADGHHFQDSISALEVLPKPSSSIQLKNNSNTVLHFHVGFISSLRVESSTESKKRQKRQDSCQMPSLIEQESWRSGLPKPAPNPQLTPSRHLIVHHSATSNNADDYTRVVRDIYTFHTEGRGWDDIGYNYIISPSGQVYAGRDGQGQATDEIKGAHFCGKNSYTMGVCLLGNYEEVEPTDSMLASLQQLLTWKCKKERLDPRYSSFHPPGLSSSAELPHIAGHRDGCSTACPGEYLYEKLPEMREKVFEQLMDCGLNLGENPVALKDKPLFHIENGQIVLHESGIIKLRIIDLQGRVIQQFHNPSSSHTLSLSSKGFVLVEATSAASLQIQKLWLP